jgi:hypothetical protein
VQKELELHSKHSAGHLVQSSPVELNDKKYPELQTHDEEFREKGDLHFEQLVNDEHFSHFASQAEQRKGDVLVFR